mgnify:FL=1
MAILSLLYNYRLSQILVFTTNTLCFGLAWVPMLIGDEIWLKIWIHHNEKRKFEKGKWDSS